MNYLKSNKPKLIVDCTHLGRNTTGIERITEELFDDKSLGTNSIQHITAKNTWLLIFKQWFYITLKSYFNPKTVILTPGFPPSILLSLLRGDKVIPYIHDMFLLSRTDEINIRAKLYMRPSLSFAVKRLDCFLVNSNKTAVELKKYCKVNAKVVLYRPFVKNVFNLEFNKYRYETLKLKELKILMLGTVEPRKNYSGALKIFKSLQDKLGSKIELHIVGRLGWGDDAEELISTPGVICHGYLSSSEVKTLVESSTFYMSTSHDEGLGLPLLELQYSGIAIVASNIPVFNEVLCESGLFINADTPHEAAQSIIDYFSDANIKAAEKSYNNLKRWNDNALKDRGSVIKLLESKRA
ncbi:glycosyltransferase [Shewanella gaetbuli]|uniref:Glycosyltransferase n=1 Tax=Shewanella gaetbuli TaxID=220752 RepID=A0A9X2CM32_9GAMM|nr:glycosyltransferase [Shewanella gaetbuli]MCL1143255.1 glycosyltransferase [Shewanella gaetbuli]